MNYSGYYKFLLSSFFLFTSISSFSQLSVTPNQTAAILAAKLAGPGITISSPVLTCAAVANGTFVSVTTPLTVDSGIILTSGTSANTSGAESFLASTNNGTAGDASLTTLAMTATHDACVLEFDFIPKGDTVSFNYQFGSEEYINSTCGQYNDAFAFFISGPGITGTQNMALVPGTNIPVTVNSINNGIPGPSGYPGYCNISNCTGMGAGSPFTTYYYDNTGGAQLTYKGYTKKLTAIHDVIPCNTYHLKIAIADASNGLYDSGVFIEAGSLKTNSLTFNRADSIGATINGVPNTIVKGCSPAKITAQSGHISGTPQTVYFTFGGTAVRGTDFTAPDTAIIAAGTDSVVITVATLPTTSAGKTIKIYLSSLFSCGIADSIDISVIDTPTAHIITADTIVCAGASFLIRATGSPGLAYSWAPAAALSSSSAMQPVATPLATTTYTMTATLPGTGCAPIVRNVTATTMTISVGILTPDTSICLGASLNIQVNGSSAFTYNWSPPAGLSSAVIKEPIATPAATITYTLTATSPAGCQATAQITITVAPANATILTPDTIICIGASVALRVSGNASMSYTWSPALGLDDPNIMQPVATPSVTTTYFLLATIPGSPCRANGKVTISIESIRADAGPDETICVRSPITLNALPDDTRYSYAWSGPAAFISDLQHSAINDAHISDGGMYIVTVTDIATGCFAADTTMVNVIPGITLTNVTASQTIHYGSKVQLNADNALYYRWSPNDGAIDNPNINNPIATPVTPTTYTVYGRDINGCLDSASVTINITYDTLFIPTAFTPNGDGLNDLFRVRNLGYYKLVDMSVFNRWGTLVYHAAGGDDKGWDGTYNGAPQDLGVYNYIIITSKPDGQLHSFKGDLTLIR